MTDFRALTAQEAKAVGLDPDFALRVLGVESGGRDGLTSSAGAYGPMQLMPGTARDMGVNPRDPVQNVKGGVRYLKQQMDDFGDPRLAAAAYNAGPGAVRKYGGVPPFRETQAYVDKVAPDTSDDIFGFEPAKGSAGPQSASSDDIFGFGGPTPKPGPKPPPMKPPAPVAAQPTVSVGADIAKGGASGVVKGAASVPDMLGQGPGSVPFFLNLAASGAQALGAKNAALGLRTTADAMSDPVGKAAQAHVPIASYQPQTFPGKVAEKAGEFLPNAAFGPEKSALGGVKALAGQVVVRGANVALPAVGAVVGRDVVKAAGGGEGAQAVGEFAGSLAGGLGAGARIPKLGASAAPTLDELQTAKTAAYKAVENSGVKYSPKAVDALVDGIQQEMAGAKISPMRHPKATDMMAELDGMRGKPMTLTELDQLRQVVRRDVANASDQSEAFMGKKMIATIDKFAESVGPGSSELNTARDLNTRYRKVETVTDARDSAQLRAGGTGNGANVDNATRQNMRRVLENTNNLTPDEEKALRSIVMGSPGQNLMRTIGRLSPTNGMLGSAANVGLGIASGGASAPISFGLMGVKAMADAATQRKVESLIKLMAQGGKRGQQATNQLAQLAKTNPKAALTAKKLLKIGVMGSTAMASATAPVAAQAGQ